MFGFVEVGASTCIQVFVNVTNFLVDSVKTNEWHYLGLPKVIQGHLRLFKATQIYFRLPKGTQGYIRLPTLRKATSGYPRLFKVT